MRVDNEVLYRWHQLDASQVLLAVADFAKKDASFVPAKNAGTTRWHARVLQSEFELLLTGPKFWDVRVSRGGGGMLLFGTNLATYSHGVETVRQSWWCTVASVTPADAPADPPADTMPA